MLKRKFTPVWESAPIINNFSLIGSAMKESIIYVSIRIRGRSSSGSKTALLESMGYQLPIMKRYFSRKEIEESHGANPEDLEKIKYFAMEYNLEILEINIPHRLITLSASIEKFNSAFNISLNEYQFREYIVRSHLGEVFVPEYLKDIVEGVYGLDEKYNSSLNVNKDPDKKTENYINSKSILEKNYENRLKHIKDRYSPQTVSRAYNFPKGARGKGQSIGVIQLGGGYNFEDIEYYLREIVNVPIPEIKDISIGGARNNPGYNFFHDFDITMIMEILSSLANAARIFVYFAPNTELGLIKALTRAIFDQDHKNNVITISWGLTECMWRKSTIKIINSLFKAAGLIGITVCVASGNKGSGDGMNDGRAHVEFPASSPFVLGCGGTKLAIEDNRIISETVWKEEFFGSFWSTGGGVSQIFPPPEYQSRTGIDLESVNIEKHRGRCLPDVAGIAGYPGYNIYLNKEPALISGACTSAVAPLWAALVALLNEKLNTPVGYINPLIYQKAKNSRAFNDISTGDNVNSKAGGYYAKSGWDACTGWGSPNGEELLKLLQGD